MSWSSVLVSCFLRNNWSSVFVGYSAVLVRQFFILCGLYPQMVQNNWLRHYVMVKLWGFQKCNWRSQNSGQNYLRQIPRHLLALKIQHQCSLYGFFPGSVVMHYLSGNCLPLSDKLFDYLRKSLNILSSHPHLLPPVHSVLDKSEDDWAFFIVDPITNSQVIQLKQECGEESVWLNYRLSRAYIWCMHKERAKLISN